MLIWPDAPEALFFLLLLLLLLLFTSRGRMQRDNSREAIKKYSIRGTDVKWLYPGFGSFLRFLIVVTAQSV